MDHHVSPSFDTISSYGPNGAVIHYKPSKENCAKVGCTSLYLCDSGAQYLDGTTDVTRTMHFGTPTQRMKDCFTYVLKGHIALATAVFPEGMIGSRLDTIARAPLWSAGLDYNHGTGHGVGSYLCVHEGPQGIGFRRRVGGEEGFRCGMTVSNEPGYYEDGAFGIRIETICITVPVNTENCFNADRYCGFETITMCPIQQKLINTALLSDKEIEWVNRYHAEVRLKLMPVMQHFFPEAVDFLVKETEVLVKN
ncbi:AMPP [Symbiodinium microadriaticum]|nr:AMPP [Symbiodinium microadriaticum]